MPVMRRNDRLRLDYELTFTTPFHCGTGLRAGLVDRTVRRDHVGYLYIPGSTLKGVLRERCEQVARLYEELDPAMREALASPHDEKRALWSTGAIPTMVTRIFGSQRTPGRLFFDDASQTKQAKLAYDGPKEPIKGKDLGKGKYREVQVDLATQARLDRLTRTAAPGALYTSEFGVKELIFEGRISGWLECFPIKELADGPTYSLLLLLTGLHLLDRLGGNKSTGKGQCTCKITSLECGKRTYTEEEWRSWLAQLEMLSHYSYVVQEAEEE